MVSNPRNTELTSEVRRNHLITNPESLFKQTIGPDVPKMSAVNGYNAAIKQADEDGHVDEIEQQQDQIGQMGLAIYLSTKK